MRYEHNFYCTKDRLLDIEFLFLNLGMKIGWRAYVLSDINYKQFSPERSNAYTDVHLSIDISRRYIDINRDYPYICWTKPIHSLDTMHELAQMWSEITAYYIRYGGRFEEIQRVLSNEGVI